MSMGDINRLSHTKWNCKYYIIFAPKFCSEVFCIGKNAIGKMLRKPGYGTQVSQPLLAVVPFIYTLSSKSVYILI